eukprot:3893240-Prymnesium_polylepis.1
MGAGSHVWWTRSTPRHHPGLRAASAGARARIKGHLGPLYGHYFSAKIRRYSIFGRAQGGSWSRRFQKSAPRTWTWLMPGRPIPAPRVEGSQRPKFETRMQAPVTRLTSLGPGPIRLSTHCVGPRSRRSRVSHACH